MKHTPNKETLAIFLSGQVITGSERKYALQKAGYTQTEAAQRIGCSVETVNQVLHDRRTSAKVAKKLASLTGIEAGTLWPCGKYG